jgi:cation-transporting ATPase
MNNKLGFSQGQVGTMVYVYCVLSAMLIVLITRTKTYFWQSYPSRLVGTVQIIDVALTFALALLGIAMTQISLVNLGLVIVVSLVSAVIIDLIYQPVMKDR